MCCKQNRIILPASPIMSRAVLLIHERHSMRPTPSCLTISALHISRNYKIFTIMDYTRSIEWIIFDLECLFHEYFCQFAYLLWSECWVLSDYEPFNNKLTQRNWPISCATCSIRQQFVNKSLEQTHAWCLWESPSADTSPLYNNMGIMTMIYNPENPPSPKSWRII